MPKVLLFGTSGNPPTGRDGHSGMVDYFVSLGQFDEIWVLPVYQHMFSVKRKVMADAGAPTFEDRMEMCRLAFERHSTKSCRVRVLRTEQEVFTDILEARLAGNAEVPTRSSTYDVVLYLKKRHPDVQFFFLVGTDTYQDVCSGKWRKSKEVMDMVTFVVVDRLGVRPKTEDLLAGVETHHPPMLTDVSSTRIRNASARELLGGTLAVESPVLHYMRERRLYGFGRQSWLGRAFQAASERVSSQWRIPAGVAGLLMGVGLGTVIAAEWRRGGGRMRLMRR